MGSTHVICESEGSHVMAMSYGVRSSGDRLAEFELFADCTKAQLRKIDSLTTLVSVPKGRVLMKQGTPAREFLIIVSGAARITRESYDGVHTLAELGRGDMVGEMGLLTGTPRTATVTATSDLEVLACSPAEFQSILQIAPSVAHKVHRTSVVRAEENELAAA
jgi:CRP-like cAMP-binding protein